MSWLVGWLTRNTVTSILQTTLGKIASGVLLVLATIFFFDQRARRQTTIEMDRRARERAQEIYRDTKDRIQRNADTSVGDVGDDYRWLRERASTRRRERERAL